MMLTGPSSARAFRRGAVLGNQPPRARQDGAAQSLSRATLPRAPRGAAQLDLGGHSARAGAAQRSLCSWQGVGGVRAGEARHLRGESLLDASKFAPVVLAVPAHGRRLCTTCAQRRPGTRKRGEPDGVADVAD